MGIEGEAKPRIAVVGLWHLGSVLCAAWSGLKHEVVGVDGDAARVAALSEGHAPIFEPALDPALAAGISAGTLRFSTRPDAVAGADVVFIALDTPVLEDDGSDLAPLERDLAAITPHLSEHAVIVVSAQVPVGTCHRWRNAIRATRPGIELVYSPENLRLGEAISCYLAPGHIVVGSATPEAGARVVKLFAPMGARMIHLDLAGAELVKHGINAFLATSVTFANEFADLCELAGADAQQVIAALREDPRIGARAYLSPGLGFSGGTLGRDLQVLEGESRRAGDIAPLFRQVWSSNRDRVALLARRIEQRLGGLTGKRIGVLGLTYKPGTSTLRRSLPMALVQELLARGASVRAFDPKAEPAPAMRDFERTASIAAAAHQADALLVLTPWPEFKALDLRLVASSMRGKLLFDAPGALSHRPAPDFAGLTYARIGFDPARAAGGHGP